ncbi:MAG: phosphoglycerate dehydrogenase [Saprospiraceae bacterium]|nr:phosphoglycerate dehydrogenase [Saprospiraceae bacterium]
MRILVTCPPMLGQIESFRAIFESRGLELVTPNVVQTLSESELEEILPTVDGWIIGDDPATERVFIAGKAGKLKAVVKWGVGTDNVDFAACKRLGIPVINTPNMFGREVADIALHYLIGLARHTYEIDRGVRAGSWPKPAGISIYGRKAGVIGFGDIGRAVASRLYALGLEVQVYDPYSRNENLPYLFEEFPNGMEHADFLVITCALTPETKEMVNAESIGRMKKGVRIVNVSRGALIDEPALIRALESGQVSAAALDVFEVEPLPMDSPLRRMNQCIFGTHNGSNTVDAVRRASLEAIQRLFGFLDIPTDDDDLKND